jgi:hypothetical protein
MTQTRQELSVDDPRAGLMTRIRAALKEVADQAAEKTSMAIVIPGAEIAEAMFKVFAGTPKIPYYDPEQAAETAFSSVVKYEPDEIPAEPTPVQVFIDESGDNADDPQVLLVIGKGDGVMTVPFDPETAEALFLAGLAACAFAKPRSRFAAPNPVD